MSNLFNPLQSAIQNIANQAAVGAAVQAIRNPRAVLEGAAPLIRFPTSGVNQLIGIVGSAAIAAGRKNGPIVGAVVGGAVDVGSKIFQGKMALDMYTGTQIALKRLGPALGIPPWAVAELSSAIGGRAQSVLRQTATATMAKLNTLSLPSQQYGEYIGDLKKAAQIDVANAVGVPVIEDSLGEIYADENFLVDPGLGITDESWPILDNLDPEISPDLFGDAVASDIELPSDSLTPATSPIEQIANTIDSGIADGLSGFDDLGGSNIPTLPSESVQQQQISELVRTNVLSSSPEPIATQQQQQSEPRQSPKVYLKSAMAGSNAMVDFLHQPKISMNEKAEYDLFTPVHAPVGFAAYKSSPSTEITIDDVILFSTTPEEALANYNRLRQLLTWTKPYFGKSGDTMSVQNNTSVSSVLGAPPDVLYLYAYTPANSLTNNIYRQPVVISNVSYSFPNDVDYIYLPSDQNDASRGGIPFPIVMSVTINLTETQSPASAERFNMDDYRSGKLVGW